MDISPQFEAFRDALGAGAPQVVWTRLVADLETPVSAMLKLAEGRPNSFLLESVEGGATRGRYSVIGFAPIWSGAAGAIRPKSTVGPTRNPTPSSLAPTARSNLFALWFGKPGSTCPRGCRQWRPDWSAISVTTWFG